MLSLIKDTATLHPFSFIIIYLKTELLKPSYTCKLLPISIDVYMLTRSKKNSHIIVKTIFFRYSNKAVWQTTLNKQKIITIPFKIKTNYERAWRNITA